MALQQSAPKTRGVAMFLVDGVTNPYRRSRLGTRGGGGTGYRRSRLGTRGGGTASAETAAGHFCGRLKEGPDWAPRAPRLASGKRERAGGEPPFVLALQPRPSSAGSSGERNNFLLPADCPSASRGAAHSTDVN